jgi:hypothetical protein
MNYLANQIDMSALDASRGINAFRQGEQDQIQQNQRNLLKEVGGQAATGNYLEAAQTAMKGGDVSTGMELNKYKSQLDASDTDKRLKLLDFFGRGAGTADTQEKWDTLLNMAQGVYGRDIDLSAYKDFNSRQQVMQFLANTKEQLEREKLRAEIAKNSVRELNGRLVRVSPDLSSASEIYAPPGMGNFKNPKEAFDAEEGLRKEFTGQSKNFVTIRDAYNNVEKLAANPSPAADIGLVYSIMKVFDPTSVVRETEYATAQNAAGVPDQVRNMWNRMLTGERLNEAQRADFVRQAQTIYGQQEQTYNRTRDQYRGITERQGLNPQNVLLDYANPSQPGPAQSEASGIAGGGMPPRQQPTQPGAQGQIPPGAVQYLRSNPSPEIIQQFEQKYGPGSAQQFLGR